MHGPRGAPSPPMPHLEVWPGKPYPLGATYDGAGTNFAVFSEVATWSGCGLNANGTSQASMGLAVGDVEKCQQCFADPTEV